MTLIMAYAVLLSAVLAAGLALIDVVVRSRKLPTRGLWAAAMGLTVVLTMFVMFGPRARTGEGRVEIPAQVLRAVETATPVAEVSTRSWLATSDRLLLFGWIGVSVLLLAAIGMGRARMLREKRNAHRGEVHGHTVFLTQDLGPAVAGVREPVVFLPAWVAALDDESQRLLLAHEVEHALRRDTWLLMAGAVVTALLPWNPVVWWLGRRLGMAVELDCDARVLARHPGVRRYADLLLVAAGKPRFSNRLLAAHFGERSSDLERRIEAMTNPSIRWRAAGVTAVIATGLLAASCEVPRPDPLAPRPGDPAVSSPTVQYFEFQVEKPVTMAAGSRFPVYPSILREAGVEGEVLVSFVVDESGQADLATLKVIRSTHALFSKAVEDALPAMRFTPAELAGQRVKQLVQQPFSFSIVGKDASYSVVGKDNTAKPETATIVERGVPQLASAHVQGISRSTDEKRLAFTYKRGDKSTASSEEVPDPSSEKRLAYTVNRDDVPSIILRDARSSPVSPLIIVDGVVMTRSLNDIDPQSIESIEVVKGAAAVSTYGARAQHGVIQITTKSGASARLQGRKRIP